MNISELETTEMDVNHPLIDRLLSLNLPEEDYAVFGSGPLFAHGLIELGHDLDLVARGEALEKAAPQGELKPTKLGDATVIEIDNGLIEIFDSWAPGEWDVNALIDQAEKIGGIKFVQLESVLKWKRTMNRPKDAGHIELIEKYLTRNGNPN